MPKMDAAGQLALLKKIIAPAGENELPVNLSRLEKIIKEEIPQALEKNAPANFPELYFDFEYVYSKFYDFLLFNPLIGKTVVALGGGFSSGKSTFLNTLLENAKILPTAIRPSTSVPAYVIHGDTEKAGGINAFAAKVDMEISDVRAIAHGFGETEDADGEITLGHLMRSVFVATPQMPYEHIAFLDTPGYSKADSADYSSKTDEKIAHSQLNASDYILWFISADAGTISGDDLDFLAGLEQDIPKLIIINKADKAPSREALQELKENIKSALALKGIRYEDVLTYSRNAKTKCDRDEVRTYLEKLNEGKAEAEFARSFKKLFVECKNYYDDASMEQKRKLARLQGALTFVGDNDEANDCLTDLITGIKLEIDGIAASRDALKTLQFDFFTEIKRISDMVHIKMPEPSEIEMMQEKACTPSAVVEEMVKEKNITDNDKYFLRMKREFADIEAINEISSDSKGNIDFESLKAQGEQTAFKGHLLKNAVTKEAYLTLLLTALLVGNESENGWLLLYRIAAGAEYTGDVRELLGAAMTMQADTVSSIIDGIRHEKLTDTFLLDSLLMQLNMNNDDEKLGMYLSDLYTLLGVSDELFSEALKVSKLIFIGNEDDCLHIVHQLKIFNPMNILCHVEQSYDNIVGSIEEATALRTNSVTIFAARVAAGKPRKYSNDPTLDLSVLIQSDIVFLCCSFDVSLGFRDRTNDVANIQFVQCYFHVGDQAISAHQEVVFGALMTNCLFDSLKDNMEIMFYHSLIQSCHFFNCFGQFYFGYDTSIKDSYFEECKEISGSDYQALIHVTNNSDMKNCKLFMCEYNYHLVRVTHNSSVEDCVLERCTGVKWRAAHYSYNAIIAANDDYRGECSSEKNNTFINMGDRPHFFRP